MPASPDLEAAVAALDPTMTLMAVIQMTGDRTLLDRYWNDLDGAQETIFEAFVDINAHAERKQVDAAKAGERKVILAIPRQNSRIWHDLREPRAGDFVSTKRGGAPTATPREMGMLTI